VHHVVSCVLVDSVWFVNLAWMGGGGSCFRQVSYTSPESVVWADTHCWTGLGFCSRHLVATHMCGSTVYTLLTCPAVQQLSHSVFTCLPRLHAEVECLRTRVFGYYQQQQLLLLLLVCIRWHIRPAVLYLMGPC
jgi:hypothetical protein